MTINDNSKLLSENLKKQSIEFEYMYMIWMPDFVAATFGEKNGNRNGNRNSALSQLLPLALL